MNEKLGFTMAHNKAIEANVTRAKAPLAA